jgi:hypothetical protein
VQKGVAHPSIFVTWHEHVRDIAMQANSHRFLERAEKYKGRRLLAGLAELETLREVR